MSELAETKAGTSESLCVCAYVRTYVRVCLCMHMSNDSTDETAVSSVLPLLICTHTRTDTNARKHTRIDLLVDV